MAHVNAKLGAKDNVTCRRLNVSQRRNDFQWYRPYLFATDATRPQDMTPNTTTYFCNDPKKGTRKLKYNRTQKVD